MATPNASIPVLDISSESDPRVAEALVDAFVRHGFVYIRNLEKDITARDIDREFSISKKFFGLPPAEKAETPLIDNKGWGGMHSELLDPKTQRMGDFKEVLNLGEFIDGEAQQPLPKALVSHEGELSAFADACHALCVKLLRLLATGLKIDEKNGGSNWFASRHAPRPGTSQCTMRLLHYPAVPEDSTYDPDVDIRAGAHSDYGSITLLFQRPGQPGLEILTSSNEWAPVPVFPPGTESDASPPILVNIGDLLSYWTNGLLKSTIHRVIFPKQSRRGGEDRYSIAFFCHPFKDAKLDPVPSPMIPNRSTETTGKSLTAREHLLSRLAATRGIEKVEAERSNGQSQVLAA